MSLIRKIATLASAALLMSIASKCAIADSIKAYTAILPPYTLGENLDNPGIAHELVEELSERSGVDLEIEYLPWMRSQVLVLENPNTLLFAATRSKERENKYAWVTVLVEPREVFVSRSRKVNSYEEAKKLPAIIVLANTPRVQKLKNLGFVNLELATTTAIAARMLDTGRADAWYTFDHRAALVYDQEGFDSSELIFGDALSKPQNWLAANKSFDADIAKRLDRAMKEIRADGTYRSILGKYIKLDLPK